MKRTRLLAALTLTALTCLTGACAENLRAQVGAPETLQASWRNATGKTTVIVNADVIVPEIQNAYLVPVQKAMAAESDLDALCAYLWPEIKFQNMNETFTEGPIRMELYYRLHKSRNPDVRIDAKVGFHTYQDGVVTGGSLAAAIKYDAEYRRRRTVNYDITFPCALVTGNGIDGHALNRQEAIAAMEKVVAFITHDAPFALANLSMAPGIIYDDQLMLENKEYSDTPFSYVGVFTRVAEGMPLQPLDEQPYRSGTNEYVTPVGYEQITINLDLDGRVACLEWSDPCKLYGEKEPCALLPFDQIIAVAGQIMPLSQAYREKYEEQVSLAVHRIALGYLSLVQPDDREICKLTPVWVFYGNNLSDKSIGPIDYVNTALFAVNAVTGMVVDLSYGY